VETNCWPRGEKAEKISKGCQGKTITPVSLGYPLSVLNTNSNLKEQQPQTAFDAKQLATTENETIAVKPNEWRLLWTDKALKED